MLARQAPSPVPPHPTTTTTVTSTRGRCTAALLRPPNMLQGALTLFTSLLGACRICLAFWPGNTAGPGPWRRGPPTAEGLELYSTCGSERGRPRNRELGCMEARYEGQEGEIQPGAELWPRPHDAGTASNADQALHPCTALPSIIGADGCNQSVHVMCWNQLVIGLLGLKRGRLPAGSWGPRQAVYLLRTLQGEGRTSHSPKSRGLFRGPLMQYLESSATCGAASRKLREQGPGSKAEAGMQRFPNDHASTKCPGSLVHCRQDNTRPAIHLYNQVVMGQWHVLARARRPEQAVSVVALFGLAI